MFPPVKNNLLESRRREAAGIALLGFLLMLPGSIILGLIAQEVEYYYKSEILKLESFWITWPIIMIPTFFLGLTLIIHGANMYTKYTQSARRELALRMRHEESTNIAKSQIFSIDRMLPGIVEYIAQNDKWVLLSDGAIALLRPLGIERVFILLSPLRASTVLPMALTLITGLLFLLIGLLPLLFILNSLIASIGIPLPVLLILLTNLMAPLIVPLVITLLAGLIIIAYALAVFRTQNLRKSGVVTIVFSIIGFPISFMTFGPKSFWILMLGILSGSLAMSWKYNIPKDRDHIIIKTLLNLPEAFELSTRYLKSVHYRIKYKASMLEAVNGRDYSKTLLAILFIFFPLGTVLGLLYYLATKKNIILISMESSRSTIFYDGRKASTHASRLADILTSGKFYSLG